MYAIAEKMPSSGKRIIFGWINALGKRRTSVGFWAAPQDISADDYEEAEEYEYDESRDCYWLASGWYEEGAEGEYFYPKDAPTHWTDLPDWPAV